MSELKIGIDAFPANPGKSGAVGAIRKMIQIVPRIDNSLNIIVFVSPLQHEYYTKFVTPETAPRIILKQIRVPATMRLFRIPVQNIILPYLCHKMRLDVHFSMNPEPIFGIPNIKEVFKIVDLQYIDVPEEIGFWKASYRKWMGRRKARRAELIIANSLYTKAKIVECFGINAERVHVIYEALDNDFFNMNWLDPQVIKGFKSRFSIDYPFIIYVSSFRPYKNHSLLLNAFSKLRERGLPYHLVLIGNDIKGYRRQIENKAIEMQLTHCIHFFDYVHHWDLRLFYAAADLAVYPSELETFGIPPLEAMACGVPVIVSNKAAIPEISGGGALVVDPHDISLMAESMYQVLQNGNIHRELSARGQAWCNNFTWERNITETLKIIREIVQ